MQTTDAPVLREFAQALRRELGANLRTIILFGSRARGDHEQWSDYDVMVLVDRETPELRKRIFHLAGDIGFEHDTLVSTVVYEKDEFDSDRYEPLFMNVRKEGIPI